MAKFKVGDIIRANKKSNERYFVTNQKDGWTRAGDIPQI